MLGLYGYAATTQVMVNLKYNIASITWGINSIINAILSSKYVRVFTGSWNLIMESSDFGYGYKSNLKQLPYKVGYYDINICKIFYKPEVD